MKQLWGIFRSIVTYYAIPWRQWQMRQLYGQFIQPGDLCFDIGAHVGNRLLALRKLGATVVAVEPQPSMASILQTFYGRSPHITLVEKAIGAQPGELTLHISSKFPTVTTVSKNWITAVQQDPTFQHVRWDQTITVPTTTLNHLIEAYGVPAFCKIDIEGHEYEALRGLSRAIPALSFEFVPAAIGIAQHCIEHLATLGDYVFNYSLGEQHQLQGKWITAVEMQNLLPTLKQSGDVYGRLKK